MTSHEPRLIAVGDNYLDVSLTKGTMTVGGNALNVAVQWKLNGWNGRYFGAVADDPEGEAVLEAIAPTGLAREDVEIRTGDTAVTLLKDEAGDRRFLLEQLGVGADYIPDEARYNDLLAADWVHLGTHADERLVRRLVADGVRFSVDVSLAHFAFSLEGVPLVLASGPDDPDIPAEPLIEALRRAGARQVLMTCGARGAFFHDGDKLSFAPALEIDVVDTCGAGDSFMASFLTSRFFRDTDAEAALREAAVKAAATCMYPGGFPQPVLPIPDWLLTKYAGIIRQVEEV